MKKLHSFFAFLLLWALPSQAANVRVMAYNVQNLFDGEDDPVTNDTEFTEGGEQKWTESVIKDKIKNLSEVILGENPDILVLSELENQAMLDRLVKDGLGAKTYISAIAGPSEDARGIRTGVVSKFPIVEVKSHQVWRDSWKKPDGSIQKTRDILEVTLDLGAAHGNQKLTVMCNHWPSRAGGPARVFMRVHAAETLAEVTRKILEKNPERTVVAMGDFNDGLTDPSFTKGLNLVKSPAELSNSPEASFYAADTELLELPVEKRGTFYFVRDKQWNELDHVLVAEGRRVRSMGAGVRYVEGSMKRVDVPFLKDGLYPMGCELYRGQTQGGRGGRALSRCMKGASDHFPLSAEFATK